MLFVRGKGGDHLLDLPEANLCQLGSGPVLLHLLCVCLVWLPANSKQTLTITAALALLFGHLARCHPEDHGDQCVLDGDEVAEFGEWLVAGLEPLADDPLIRCHLSLVVTTNGDQGIGIRPACDEFAGRAERPC